MQGGLLKGPHGFCGARRVEPQPRQRQVHQLLLARAQPVAAMPPVKTVGGSLQRPNADFSAGTRSVFSQEKVPLSSSGSRPKCPYAEVAA